VAVLLVAPGPVSVEVIVPLVLLFSPTLVPVTSTLMWHEPPADNVPALRLTLLLPAVALSVPLHVLLVFGVEATCKPAGRMSLKPTPVRASPELGFVISKVKLVVPFSGIVVAPNALIMVGGLATVRVAVLLA